MDRYPLKLRKIQDGQILSKRVFSAEEEAAHIEEGWSPKLPVLPTPAPQSATSIPLTDDTAAAIGNLAAGLAELGAQISALLVRIELLEQKRGPGRPKESR